MGVSHILGRIFISFIVNVAMAQTAFFRVKKKNSPKSGRGNLELDKAFLLLTIGQKDNTIIAIIKRN